MLPRNVSGTRALLVLAVAYIAASCSPSSHDPNGPDDGGGTTCEESGLNDRDRDGIADIHEGDNTVDTDRDGTPDYQDIDSDGDEITDDIEAGRDSCEEEPIDSDDDGTPDFQDVDSDGNGIADSVEGTADHDGDGIGDWQDLDDDGDRISDLLEVGDDPIDPADSDGDGIPDYHDLDSDNDSLPDEIEGSSDVDQDGLHNFRDRDADGDGYTDQDESTDDCDDDGLANFLDWDSDNDGLTDAVERELHTDPCNEDSDGDGLTDLVERAIGTDPTDGTSVLAPEDYFVILPYNDPPQEKDLDFETNVKQADVYFLIDTTGSMSGALNTIRTSLSTFIVPAVADVVRDVEFGVGRFDDIPYGSFGGPSDVAYENIHDISGDIASVQDAIDTFGTGGGADGPESDVPALYCTATGEGISTFVDPSPGCLEGRFGYPCFRPYSLPIILLFTDNPFHNGPPDGISHPYGLADVPNWLDAIAALNDIGAVVLGFNTGSEWDTGAAADLEATAIATNAVRDDGTPLTWSLTSSGSGLDHAVVDAISDLSSQVSRDVSTEVEESPIIDDGVNASDFVLSILPLEANPTVGVDSFDDTTFYNTQAGTILTFAVTFQNTIVPETQEPQVFIARIVVVGDNTVRLDDRRVVILVPPVGIPIG